MATAKPRITVTLDQEVYETLQGLSELQGVSMSSIVVDLLRLVDPVQRKVLDTMRRALALQGEARADLASQLEQAQAQAEAMTLPLFEALEGFGAATQPPHSNTGVTSPNPPAESDPKKPQDALSRASRRGSKT